MFRYRSCWAVRIVLLACNLLIAAVPAHADPKYTMIDLGTLGPGPYNESIAFGINNVGQIVGESRVDGYMHPFLWTPGTPGMVDLLQFCPAPSCPAFHHYGASAINDNSDVVVMRSPDYRVLLYRSPLMDLIPPLAGWGVMDGAWGITCVRTFPTDRLGLCADRDPTVVVGSGHSDDHSAPCGTSACAMRYFRESVPEVIIATPSTAFAINKLGQIAGYDSNFHAYRYTGGSVTLLGELPDDTSSAGYAINDRGDVVGYSSKPDDGIYHAVIWKNGAAGPLDLGALDAVPRGYNAVGVNNGDPTSGRIIVGVARELDIPYRDKSFLVAVPDTGVPQMLDLESLFTPLWPEFSGLRVYGMNDSGWIVGLAYSGYNPPPYPDKWHAILLKPIAVNTPASRRASFCLPQSTKDNLKWDADASSVAGTVAARFGWGPAAESLALLQVLYITELRVARAICGDPFDANFQTVFAPEFHTLHSVASDSCVTPPLATQINQAMDHLGRAASNLQAMRVTMDREQTAFTFGDDASVSLQDTALTSYTNAVVSEFNAYQTGIANVATQLTGTPCDVTITPDDITAFKNDVATRGLAALSQVERDTIALFGVDPSFVLAMIAAADPARMPLVTNSMLRISGQIARDWAAGYGP
jgi:probable HAF family extracellular repeat protein